MRVIRILEEIEIDGVLRKPFDVLKVTDQKAVEIISMNNPLGPPQGIFENEISSFIPDNKSLKTKGGQGHGQSNMGGGPPNPPPGLLKKINRKRKTRRGDNIVDEVEEIEFIKGVVAEYIL